MACIWHIERVQIDDINKNANIILPTFSLPWSSSLLKVPITLLYDVIESDQWRRKNVNFRPSLRLCPHQYYVYFQKKTSDRRLFQSLVTTQNAKIQRLLTKWNIIKKSRNIFILKEDFKISCYDMCSSLLSLIKDIERQPQPTKKADRCVKSSLNYKKSKTIRNEILIRHFIKKVVVVDLLRDGSFFFTDKTLVFYKLKWSHKGDGRLRETVWEVKIDCYIVKRRPRDLHAKSVADMYLELITPVLLFLFQKRTFHIIALIAEHFTALTSRGRKEGRKVYYNQNCFCSTGSLRKIKFNNRNTE